MNVTINAHGDQICEHGTAMDVHCCGCHSGYIFDPGHVCIERCEACGTEVEWLHYTDDDVGLCADCFAAVPVHRPLRLVKGARPDAHLGAVEDDGRHPTGYGWEV